MEAVNLAARLFVAASGATYPITNLFDSDGDECEPGDAVVAVAGEGDKWFSIDLKEYTGETQ